MRRDFDGQPIIPGITEVDPNRHIVVADYPARCERDDGVHVVEIANQRLAHTALSGGSSEGRIAVFGRWISQHDLANRQQAFHEDDDAYLSSIYKETSR